MTGCGRESVPVYDCALLLVVPLDRRNSGLRKPSPSSWSARLIGFLALNAEWARARGLDRVSIQYQIEVICNQLGAPAGVDVMLTLHRVHACILIHSILPATLAYDGCSR